MSFWAFFDPFWPFGCGRRVKTGGLDGPFETIFGDFFRATWLEALGMGARFAHSRDEALRLGDVASTEG